MAASTSLADGSACFVGDGIDPDNGSRHLRSSARGDLPEQVVKMLADAAGAEDSADRRFLEELTHKLDKLLKGLVTGRLHRRVRQRLARPFRPEELQ